MSPEIRSIVWRTATVVLIVAATRWLLDRKEVETPKIIDNTHLYGVRRRVKIAGFGGVGLFTVLLIYFLRETFNPRDLWLYTFPLFFIFLGIWLASGSVITSDSGIVKKTLWSARTIRWQEISTIRFYERQNYIELLGDNRKLSVDTRFVALKQLLDEIVRHTNVPVDRK